MPRLAVQCSPCTSILAAPLWMLSEGRCRPEVSPKPLQPVMSWQHACREWPGGVQGCICHRSLATPLGWRHQEMEPSRRCSGQGEGLAPSALWTLVFIRCPACFFLQGRGRDQNSAPNAFLVPPPALSSLIPRMPLLLRLSGVLGQFSI